MYRQVWLIRGNETHSEGDNWRCVPAESRKEFFFDQCGTEDGNRKPAVMTKDTSPPSAVEDFLGVDFLLIGLRNITDKRS